MHAAKHRQSRLDIFYAQEFAQYYLFICSKIFNKHLSILHSAVILRKNVSSVVYFSQKSSPALSLHPLGCMYNSWNAKMSKIGTTYHNKALMVPLISVEQATPR